MGKFFATDRDIIVAGRGGGFGMVFMDSGLNIEALLRPTDAVGIVRLMGECDIDIPRVFMKSSISSLWRFCSISRS